MLDEKILSDIVGNLDNFNVEWFIQQLAVILTFWYEVICIQFVCNWI